eukprot:Nk52_evm31s1992 gene=Nk52_evmTU31s1992
MDSHSYEVEEVEDFIFNAESSDEEDISPKLARMCEACARPKRVCLCAFYPEKFYALQRTRVFILMHPHEIKRPFRSAELVRRCLGDAQCVICVHRRFSRSIVKDKFPELYKVLTEQMKNTCVLFPGKNATTIKEYASNYRNSASGKQTLNVIVIDGTWKFAQEMLKTSEEIMGLSRVIVSPEAKSEYVIHMQPDEEGVCTLEAIAYCLRDLEENEEVFDVLMRPLRGMVRLQRELGDADHGNRKSKLT